MYTFKNGLIIKEGKAIKWEEVIAMLNEREVVNDDIPANIIEMKKEMDFLSHKIRNDFVPDPEEVDRYDYLNKFFNN